MQWCKKWLMALNDLDRRWIFVAITLAVVIPTLYPLDLPIKISDSTRTFYDKIEHLPENSLVCMSFDYGPGTKIECHPMAEAALHHLFRRNCRVVAIALWPEGVTFAREALTKIGAQYGKEEGRDYVNLGYKAGGEMVLRGAGDNFQQIYSQDVRGCGWKGIPLLSAIEGWRSFALVCDWSMGKPGILEFVRVVHGQYGGHLIGGATAVTTPEAYPLLESGQIEGLLQGLRGAAEYEKLLDCPGSATRGMDAQSTAHYMLAFLIVLSNLGYWIKRRSARKD